MPKYNKKPHFTPYHLRKFKGNHPFEDHSDVPSDQVKAWDVPGREDRIRRYSQPTIRSASSAPKGERNAMAERLAGNSPKRKEKPLKAPKREKWGKYLTLSPEQLIKPRYGVSGRVRMSYHHQGRDCTLSIQPFGIHARVRPSHIDLTTPHPIRTIDRQRLAELLLLFWESYVHLHTSLSYFIDPSVARPDTFIASPHDNPSPKPGDPDRYTLHSRHRFSSDPRGNPTDPPIPLP